MKEDFNNFNETKFVDAPYTKEHPTYRILNNYKIDKDIFLPKPTKEDYNNPNKMAMLLIGYDTEYQTTNKLIEVDKLRNDEDLDRDEEEIDFYKTKGLIRYKYLSKKGLLNNEILSYQTYCRIIIPSEEGWISNGYEWGCIVHPFDSILHTTDGRLTLTQLLHYTIARGKALYPDIKIPKSSYLLSHFSRADIPSLKDFQWEESDLVDGLMNIRGVYTGRKDIKVRILEDVELEVKLRDTINLAPTLKKSLNDIGKMLGFEKLQLGKDDKEEQYIKDNMKEFMYNNYDKFKEYGILDAKITTEFAHQLLNISWKETETNRIPKTLTSIATSKLIKMWEKKYITMEVLKSGDYKPVELDICGKKVIEYKRYNEKTGRYKKITKRDYIDKVKWRVDFVANTYHGGRNEQFMFGATWIDEWSDWDLRSAYATAMCMIGKPDWDKTKTIYDIEKLWKLGIDDLAYAQVEFEFPSSVRYPCLPVRGGEQGLIFPLRGNSLCGLPELKLARKLGAKITLQEAVTVPSNKDDRIFEEFIKYCYQERNIAKEKFGSQSLFNHFWKEMSNSTYGKTAQGLRVRKVFDLTAMGVKPLPESQITNPFFASFITSIVRASLAEIMNKLPRDKMVFSVTTDGFLTNATKEDIDKSQDGEVCIALSNQIRRLGNKTDILEIKHKCRQALGVRTRLQATLKEFEYWKNESGEDDRDIRIVLAKSGIKLNERYEKHEENRKVVNYFLNRKWNHKLMYKNFSGIREMSIHQHDLINKPVLRNLSMEFDWKRKPSYTKDIDIEFDGKQYSHIYMETKPWKDLDEFILLRQKLDEFNLNNYQERIIRNVKDYENLKDYVGSKVSLSKKNQKGLSKIQPGEMRLKQMILCGWRKRQGGMLKCYIPIRISDDEIRDKEIWKITFKHWVEIFKTIGIEITKQDFWNSKTQPKEYTPHRIPKSKKTIEMLNKLKLNHFPYLKIDELLSNEDGINLLDKDKEETQFLMDKSRVFK